MTFLILKYVTKEFVVIGIIAYIVGYVQHKIKDKAIEGYNRFGERVNILQPWRNAYFCPDYCNTNHVHYAHDIEYLCNSDTVCSHYVYRNIKKDKKWQSKIKE